VFLASCSYSHLGGWLEGAFMSAINAVAGGVVSLNQGNVGALNAEAQNCSPPSGRWCRWSDGLHRRHCERSEAIQGEYDALDCFVAALLAMTT